MPRLPDLGERPVPRVSGEIAPIRGDIPATGIGQAISSVGQSMMQVSEIARREQERMDTLLAEDSYNKLQSKRLEMEFSTDAANPGFRNVRGRKAIDPEFQKTVVERFQNSAKEFESGLMNDNQRALFRRRSFVADLQLKNSLFQHVSNEQKAFANDTDKSVLETELRNITANWDNDDAFLVSLPRAEAAARRALERDNAPEEEVSLAAAKVRDSAWTARVEGALTTNPLLAQKMFNEHIGEFGPQNRIVLERKISSAVRPIEAKRAAELILGGEASANLKMALQVGGNDLVNAVLLEQPKAAREIQTKVRTQANFGEWVSQAEVLAEKMHPDDPVFRDLVVSQVKGYVNTIVSAQQAVQKMNSAVLMSAALGLEGQQKPLTLDDLLSTGKARQAWVGLDVNEQRGILSLLEHNAKEAQGRPVRSDSAVVGDLFRRIHAPDDDPRKITTPGQLAPYFSRGINRTDYDWLKKEIDDRQTPEGQRLSEVRKKFFDGVSPQFDKSTMMVLDAKGKEDAYKFWQYSTDLERQYRKAGKDPYDLYNPSHPDYLGKKVQAFQRTMEEQIRGMAENLRRKAPAALPPEKQRKEGETIDQYRKRLGLE